MGIGEWCFARRSFSEGREWWNDWTENGNGSWKSEVRSDLATLYGDSFGFSEIENGQFITETGPFDRGFIVVEILNVQFSMFICLHIFEHWALDIEHSGQSIFNSQSSIFNSTTLRNFPASHANERNIKTENTARKTTYQIKMLNCRCGKNWA